MDKKGGIYIVIAIFTVALLMLLQYNKPKEVNWFPSYVAKHEIPYGTLVFNEVVQQLFPNKIQQVHLPPFEFLEKNPAADGTYFFVDNKVEFGEAELHDLLDWTSEGNTLFVATNSFEEQLLDTLGLDLGNLYGDFNEDQSHRHQLVNPSLKTEEGYIFEKEAYASYFQKIDTTLTTVIGTVANISENDSVWPHFNVIEQDFGDGKIFLSTFPKAFTNYFILKDKNKDYTAGLLSYLDTSRTIYMDNHHKSGKSVYTSPMYIFLNVKEFKWAYYLVLIGAVIYIIFEAKRKQRAIPVVRPLKNQTLAFTRTIADMYFEKGESKQIVEHKIAYFLEYIRSRFYLGTIEREVDFYRNLAMRSSHSFAEIEQLFTFLERLRNQNHISDTELQKLNTSIEKFKTKAHGK